MSGPPPSYDAGRPKNPDSRPLPPGWIEQYDANYKSWFYVDTRQNPPVSSWTHPAGAAPPPGPPPQQYAPPPGSPYNQPPPQGGYGQQPPYG
ncbi:hypothetical protein EXIGLDRAFT_782684, partial [Exidia glandulosa HHB12029]